MEIKTLNSGSGWLWIKQGTYLFKKRPALLASLVLIAVAGLIGVASIPVVGEPLSTLLFPVIFSGLLWGCHALEHNEELELAHLFLGFKRNMPQLVMLGGLNLLANYLILGVMKITGGGQLVDLMVGNSSDIDPEIFVQAVSGASFAILISIVLTVILLMATQFAPMLVTFDKVLPLEALKASLQGSWRNLAPLSVYGVMMMLYMVVATLPLFLGWFILMPIMLTSVYAAYRGIFPWAEEGPVSEPAIKSTES